MYHHKKDSGVSLGEASDKEAAQPGSRSPQFSDHYSPQPNEISDVASNVNVRQPRALRKGLHFNQLSESERIKLFDACFDILPIHPNKHTPNILSGYPIPHSFNVVDPLHPKTAPHQSEEQSPLWHATYGINGKQKGLKKFFEDYEFLHNGGESPSDEENLSHRFPSEFAAEESRQLRRHAAELHGRLRKIHRHQGSSESEPCERILPTTLIGEMQINVKKEEPERWFKTIDEAWENRPRSRGHSKHQKASS